MPFALADAYMILRVDSGRLSTDIRRGVGRADLYGSGRMAGERYGSGLRRGLAGVGKVAAGVGLALGVGAVEAAKAATEFQAAMTRIRTQAGGSARDVGVLSKQVLALAPATQQGPQQLAEGLYHLKSLGMDNVHAMRALKTASDLAAVGGANLEETTSAIGAAWRSGIKGAHSFGAAAATVNAIIGAGNMRMQDFITALGSGILPAARTFGVSFKSVGAALALMTDEGIPAVDAATRLRMTLSLIGAPSMVAVKQLHSIGLSSTALAQAMRGPQGILGAVALLKHHLDASGLSATKQAQVISRAFGGGRSSSAIMTLLNNVEVLRQKQAQLNRTTGRYGDAVAAQRKTVQAQLALLRSSFETFGVQAGRALLPPLNSVLQWINRTGIPAAHAFWLALTGHGQQPAVQGGGLAQRRRGGPFPADISGLRERQAGGAYPAPPVSGWRQFLAVLDRIGADIRRSIGPALASISGWITHTLLPAVGRMWRTYLPGFRDLGHAIASIWGSLRILWRAWKPFLGPVIGAAIAAITLGFRALAAILRYVVAPLIRGLAIATQVSLRIARVAFGNFAANVRGIFHNIRVAWDAVTGWIVKQARTALHDALGVFNWLGKHVGIVWDEIQLAALKMVYKILGAFSHIPLIGGMFKKAQGVIGIAIGKIQADINRLTGRNVNLGVHLHAVGTGPFSGKPLARGGVVWGPGTETSDDVPARLSRNEFVVRARAHRKYGTAALRAVNEGRAAIGYAAGGSPVEIRPRVSIEPGVGKLAQAVDRLLAKGARAYAKEMFGGSGGAIVRYALRYLHKVPYVWGGTTPRGWDCSGFTGWVYRHRGYPQIPRTSQQQQLWATPSGNIPGALVFFYGRRGGASHVGINMGNGRYIGADDPALGTTIQPTAGNTGFGVPPGGFHTGYARMFRGIPGIRGGGGTAVELGRAMAAQLYGWRGRNWSSLYELWQHESGWKPRARNRSSGAAGIPQDITGNFHGGARGQILWGLRYIRGRYGSPSRAWRAWQSRSPHWYARGTKGAAPGWGWVGEEGPELVHFRGGERVLDHLSSLLSGASGGSLPGYQHGAPSRSSRLSAVDRFAFGNETTVKAISRAMERVRHLIRRLYDGTAQRWRLEDSRRAWHHLDNMARELHDLRHTLASARSYRATVRQNLSGLGALSNIPITEQGSETGPLQVTLTGGLRQQLANIRRFGNIAHRLRRAGLSRALLRQVVNMGPEQGIPYAEAILSLSRRQIGQLDTTERQIGQAARTVAGRATADVYGLSGVNFVRGLRRERRSLENEMRHAGRVFATEAARWLHVPRPRRYHRRQFGGPITEGVIGTGVSTGDSWEFHAGEQVLPGRGRGGPLVHIDNVNVRERADINLIGQRLSFAVTRAGLGG